MLFFQVCPPHQFFPGGPNYFHASTKGCLQKTLLAHPATVDIHQISDVPQSPRRAWKSSITTFEDLP